MKSARIWAMAGVAIVMPLLVVPAAAQQSEQQQEKAPMRTRVGLGVQLVPSFPGSKKMTPRPLVDGARARGDTQFEFEAADEAFGFSLARAGNFAFGPAIGFQGGRSAKDVGANLPEVGFTIEVGGYAQYAFSDAFRARVEARKGLGGHKGLIGYVGVDYVARDGDKWLFSIGPRVTLADDTYHRAYFGVTPTAATASGLPAYAARGGVQSAGAIAGYLRQFSPRWGLYSYARYDRLVGDPARSPIVRRLGSRDQFSAGLAITRTFGRLQK